MPNYARADLVFERGEGVYLHAADGRKYLDFGAGVAVVSLGHCHPHLVKALTAQAATLWHCSNLYRIPGQEKLAERLVAASFADAVFFSNSGAEAMECALKMIRRYHDETGNPGRYRTIVCNEAFHGRTLATIAAGGQPKHMKGFDPVVQGFDRVSFGNLNEARAAVGPETAAILVEPVQGEGGTRAAPDNYLKGLRAMADEFGLLLVLDEVQSGMGRTGKLFAHEWAGIRPDVVATAKGLGGGFPVGATLAVEKVAKVMTAGTHGSTFGGNPLAMAAGNAVLDVMLAPGFLDGVQATAKLLRAEVEGLARRFPRVIAEVRGMGLLLGLKTIPENLAVVKALQDAGLLTVPAGDNVVRLLPPLVIEAAHVAEAVAVMDRVFAALAERAA
ncbi:MAG: aspartate aminotransferase family protein [Alphaproteobacteria bacterium]|nr:aspartate aminotransferase family protein [Alphaproteobacteria bacterium]